MVTSHSFLLEHHNWKLDYPTQGTHLSLLYQLSRDRHRISRIQPEIYYWSLAHTVMEAEESRSLWPAALRPGRGGGMGSS